MLFQLAVELIKLVIDLGLEYENIETIAIEVCEIIMANEGYRGDIICPGVVPNYGPHVSTFTNRHMSHVCNNCLVQISIGC